MKQQKPANEQIQENVQNMVQKAQDEVEESREPWYRVSRRAQFLIVAYLLIFVLFTILALYVHFNPVLSVDVTITKEFQENHTPALSSFMVAVSFLGNQSLIFSLLILLTAAVFWAVRLRLEALFIIGLSVVSTPINLLLKFLVSRPRPTNTLVDVFQRATGQSFPSGHVMSYVAFWGLLFSFCLILFRRDRWWIYVLLIVSGLFVVLVGPSRIYLGDHWASDVIGAYLISGLMLGITLWIYLALKKRAVLTRPLRSARHQLPVEAQ
ncbi:phosphatase PAP2 family protein [Dictyobacter arantiisoli]|uniref:Phosphatidic acid phosphatase type 2/haloperoxidase domain-containing protein n=1 Tax=Dictyobacter arantiisoli TaxID=2014874 RepID=A0A5A5TFE8_9CHLR|nr:phosphatase PAP2 family protein [Dictyobacter arantiisoli]GCF09866.1 hypothetical protein KDI_34300 [Dictyobacter arantiisoli]